VNFAQRRTNVVPRAMPNIRWPVDRPPHPVATGIFLVYLFLMMSRGVEMLAVVLHVNLHLTMILMFVSLVGATLTGGLLNALKTPVVIMFTALTCWLMVTTVTSQWRGGSFMTITNYWIPSFASVLLVPSLISTLDQCRKACYALAFSLLPILWATVAFQAQIQGRDETFFGTLGNPNDLAFSLLLLIPFAVLVIKSESLLSWKTILCSSAIVFAVTKTLRTGSRAGLLTIVICFVILFLSGKMKTKVAMLGVAALIAAICVAAVPRDILLRYGTLFSGTSNEAGMSADEYSAVESTRARKLLFQESVRLMLEHPLFGVGPGIFSAALAAEQKQLGQRQTWREAHNSFTQLGCEAGIPALGLYLAALLYCMKRTIRVYRRARSDPNQIVICRMAATLFVALTIYTICGAFGTYSYTFHFPILAGLVQAFYMCASKEMKTGALIVHARLQARQPRGFRARELERHQERGFRRGPEASQSSSSIDRASRKGRDMTNSPADREPLKDRSIRMRLRARGSEAR
jgi:O-antigen ligase